MDPSSASAGQSPFAAVGIPPRSSSCPGSGQGSAVAGEQPNCSTHGSRDATRLLGTHHRSAAGRSMGSPSIASGGWDVDPCTTVRGVMGWSRGVLMQCRGVLDLHNATAEILMP